jgi:uncharacterized protein YbjT (DUF2867 family)
MKLLILGASGAIGTWLTHFAVQAGHDVTVLVRPASASRFSPPSGVQVVVGEALDPIALATALEGQSAVASCLGLRRKSKLPWAPLLSPPDLTANVARLLSTAMPQAGVRRIVAVSAAGVAESITQLTTPVRWMVSAGNVGTAYRDLAEMERILSASRLDWLAVRAVTLVDGPPTGRVGKVSRFGLFSIIRRSDVATWMLGALARPTPYIEQTIMLGTLWKQPV